MISGACTLTKQKAKESLAVTIIHIWYNSSIELLQPKLTANPSQLCSTLLTNRQRELKNPINVLYANPKAVIIDTHAFHY